MNDQEWLLQRRPKATEDQIEAFMERVAIMLESFANPSPTLTRYYFGLALASIQ